MRDDVFIGGTATETKERETASGGGEAGVRETRSSAGEDQLSGGATP